MTAIWARDEEGDLRQRIKHGARRKGQKSADFVRRALEAALEATEASFVTESDRNIGQSERCTREHHNS